MIPTLLGPREASYREGKEVIGHHTRREKGKTIGERYIAQIHGWITPLTKIVMPEKAYKLAAKSKMGTLRPQQADNRVNRNLH